MLQQTTVATVTPRFAAFLAQQNLPLTLLEQAQAAKASAPAPAPAAAPQPVAAPPSPPSPPAPEKGATP